MWVDHLNGSWQPCLVSNISHHRSVGDLDFRCQANCSGSSSGCHALGSLTSIGQISIGPNKAAVRRRNLPCSAEYQLQLGTQSHPQDRNNASLTPQVAVGYLSDANVAAFASLLKQYGKSKALNQGRHVHDLISRNGLSTNVFLGNCLIEFYGKSGSVGEARAVFDTMLDHNVYSWNMLLTAYAVNGDPVGAMSAFTDMPERDVVSWSVVISVCVRNGQGERALYLFRLMQRDGVEPNRITFLSAVEACTSRAALEDGYDVHSAIINGGYETDIAVQNALVNMYGKCHALDKARIVFWQIPQRDVVSWSAMIAACALSGHDKEALKHFRMMELEGIKPDKVAFLGVVDACASIGSLAVGLEVHVSIVTSGFDLDIVVGNSLINMFGKCGSLDHASVMLDRMLKRDVVTWSAMITACLYNDKIKEALDIFWRMQLQGFNPNKVTFKCVLDACARLEALNEGWKVHDAIPENVLMENVDLGMALINMYSKCGAMDIAMTVFQSMPSHNVASWNAMIATCLHHGKAKEALQLYHQMCLTEIKPDKSVYISVLGACTLLTALENGQEIHVAVIGHGIELDAAMGSALIHMYGKCGSLDSARTLFGRMPELNTFLFSAMIGACSQNGYSQVALQYFYQMHEGVKPNEVTFLCVLTACNHTGQVDDARQYFTSMTREHGLSHTVEHYACMIDLLGRAGLLEEAEDLIIKMPFEKGMAWLSLLSACRIHGDVDRAARVANYCFDLDSHNAAPHVILSNVHAAAGR